MKLIAQISSNTQLRAGNNANGHIEKKNQTMQCNIATTKQWYFNLFFPKLDFREHSATLQPLTNSRIEARLRD